MIENKIVASTSARLKQALSDKGYRQVDLLEKVQPLCKKYGAKMNKSDISQYVSGKVRPGQDKLTILAKALDVDELWLMGYDLELAQLSGRVNRKIGPESEKSNQNSKITLELLDEFEKLNQEGKETLLQRAKELTYIPTYCKSDVDLKKVDDVITIYTNKKNSDYSGGNSLMSDNLRKITDAIAAHNDDNDPEQIELMNDDLNNI